MKRGWFLVLAVSIGLNAGLLYNTFHAERWGAGPSRPPFLLPPGPPGEGRPYGSEARDFAGHRLRRLADRLRLDADQRSRMSRIIEENMPVIMEKRDRVQKARHALREEYLKPEPDGARVRSLVRELNESQACLDSLVAETMLREADLLTPDQRARYLDAIPWERGAGPGLGHGRGARRGRR
ncbi:MAG: periplasmic heavy metal sensor [Candidatus Eisenbacteria bacterium]